MGSRPPLVVEKGTLPVVELYFYEFLPPIGDFSEGRTYDTVVASCVRGQAR